MNSANSIAGNGITQGVIWKQLLRFFFPILLGTLFQTLYNTVDAVIVGNILGKEALAAVGGGTGTAINLLIGFFTGVASGATVIISQYYGAQKEELVHKAIHNACAIGLWGGILISIAGFMTSEPLLRLINTPEDIIDMAVRYMKIYFAGTFIMVMYNIGAGIFRAFGDSRRPLYFLIAGSLVNIALDILLVGVLHLGVEGAAYATVLSQLVSLVLVTAKLRHRKDCCALVFRDIRLNAPMLRRTLAIGLPAGIQSVLYTVSNLMIVAAVNRLGTDTVAAWSAYCKIDSFYWMFCGSLGIAITTFVGQNYGAGLVDRSRKGVRDCFAIGFIGTFAIEAMLLLFSRTALMLFTDDVQVIEIGNTMIWSITPFYFTFLFVEILSGAIRGTGKSFIPTVLTVFSIVGLRTLWLAVVPAFAEGITAIMMCYPVTWIVCGTAFVIYYRKGHIYDVPHTGKVSL